MHLRRLATVVVLSLACLGLAAPVIGSLGGDSIRGDGGPNYLWGAPEATS